MIVHPSVRKHYDEWHPFLVEVEKRVESTLTPFCRKQGFVFEGRLKSLASLSEKIDSGRSSWESLDDLYACTIAVPLFEDEQIACEALKRNFEILADKKRGSTPKSPDVFRFDSTRITAKLRKPENIILGNEHSIFKVAFEIQIKSLFEFAWTKTTHALTYKTNLVDWKRYRLAAHLKAAVEQADFLLVGFEQAAQLVPDGYAHDVNDKSKIRTLFHDLVETKRIPMELVPKDWSRFIDNVYTALQVISGNGLRGRASRPLNTISSACGILKDYFSANDENKIPRSLSLFQIVIGILCSSAKFDGHCESYYILKGDAFSRIFPAVDLPGSEFSVDSNDFV